MPFTYVHLASPQTIISMLLPPDPIAHAQLALRMLQPKLDLEFAAPSRGVRRIRGCVMYDREERGKTGYGNSGRK
jgi:hypothetical protein